MMNVQEFLEDWEAIQTRCKSLHPNQQLTLLEQWVILRQKTLTSEFLGKAIMSWMQAVGDTILEESQKAGLSVERVKELQYSLGLLKKVLGKAAENRKSSPSAATDVT